MAKKKGMSRRDFFRLSMLGGSAVGLGGFAAASLGIYFPTQPVFPTPDSFA